MKWITKEVDKTQIRSVSRRFNIDALMATVLVRRQQDAPQDALYLLENKKIFLLNPFLLPDMDLAVERIVTSLGDLEKHAGKLRSSNPEKIMIIGDRDTDGITSTAMIASFFKKFEVSPILRLPQGDESYGITVDLIDEAKTAGVTLIICVDNGSNAYDSAKLALKEHIDLIVIDHHDVDQSQLLPVVAFVNPKRNDKYLNTQLSASALVLKTLFCLDFSLSGYLGQCDVLLHASIGNTDTYYVTAMQVINWEIKATLQVSFSSKNLKNWQERERIISFVQGREIFIFNAQEQIPLLSAILNVEVVARDIASELEQFYSGISQYDLLEIMKKSRFFCYQERTQLRDGLLLLYRLLFIADNNKFTNYNENFGLAALGLLADLAPVLGENRIIIHHGLASLNGGDNTVINQLLSKLNLLRTPITEHDINWKIIPLINASGRMGKPDVALRALLSQNHLEQKELIDELVLLNEQRRKLTTQWWEDLQSTIYQSLEIYDKKIVFICEKNLPRGLTGLLAGRISRAYKCFAIVIAIKNKDVASASMRSGHDYHVAPFIDYCKDILIDSGGHAQAGGFTIKVNLLDELKKRVALFNSGLTIIERGVSQEKEFYYDIKISPNYFNSSVIELVDRFSPYGSKFEPLIFYISNVKLESATLVGKQEEHLKMTVTIGDQYWQCVFWGEANCFAQLRAGMYLDLLCKLRKDYNRFQKYQLELVNFNEVKL